MRKLLFLLAIVLAVAACRKHNSPTTVSPTRNPQPAETQHKSFAAAYTSMLEKKWTLDGYSYTTSHPSGGPYKSDTSYYNNVSVTAVAINDTTIDFNGSLFYLPKYSDTSKGYICYGRGLGGGTLVYSDHGTTLYYYYKQDSIKYRYHDWGVSFTTHKELHSKK